MSKDEASQNAGDRSEGGRKEEGAPADDLDTILNEYESAAGDDPQPGKKDAKPDELASLRSEVEALRATQQSDQEAKDIARALETVKGELGEMKISDKFITGYLRNLAVEDPRFLKAWQNQGSDPKGWNKALAAVAKEIGKELSDIPDKGATEDREAVASFVRGASNKAPEDEPDKFGGQSDHEFRKSVQDKYGYTPAV